MTCLMIDRDSRKIIETDTTSIGRISMTMRLLIFNLFVFTGLTLAGQPLQSDAGKATHPDSYSTSGPCTVMALDQGAFETWMRQIEGEQEPVYDETLREMTTPTSFNLFPYLTYTPAERNQGSCGNCWVWTGTTMMEIQLNALFHVRERLSIQYLNSCYSGPLGNACCDGNLEFFRNFYMERARRGAILWDNCNAGYVDRGRECSDSTSPTDCSDIATRPSFPITQITEPSRIMTYRVPKETVISNIKNVLVQNKAVAYALFMPTPADRIEFHNFWNDQNETSVWNPDHWRNHVHSGDQLFSHVILIIGYVDNGGSDRYWICLNSWGAPSNRSHCLLRLDMNIDYDGVFRYNTGTSNLHLFQAMDIQFGPGFVVDAPWCNHNIMMGNWGFIDWYDTGTRAPNVAIDLYKGSTLITPSIVGSTPNNSSGFNWHVPTTLAPGSDYRIQVRTPDGSIVGYSNFFTLSEQAWITILAPASASVWIAGTTQTVLWTKHGAQDDFVAINLNGPTRNWVIADNTENDGHFDWVVPEDMAAGNRYSVSIMTADSRLIAIGSRFTIQEVPPSIQVTLPSVRSFWRIGTTHSIRWRKHGRLGGSVFIQLMKGKQIIRDITTITPNNGSFSWTINKGLEPGTDYWILVETTDHAIWGYSTNFRIG